MEEHLTSSLYNEVAARKLPFFAVFFGIMVLSYGLLFAIDFIPEPVAVAGSIEESEVSEEPTVLQGAFNALRNGGLLPKKVEEVESDAGLEVVIPEVEVVEEPEPVVSVQSALPMRIIIDKLDKKIKVNNPTSDSIAVLDQALLSGAVRHPDSADFQNTGNIFVLAHSSYLPNVLNKSFQAFNGIQKLTWGDTVRLESDDTQYVYRVERVYKAKASEVVVPNSRGEAKLTLATCNSFGAKDDRFVVEAVLIETVLI